MSSFDEYKKIYEELRELAKQNPIIVAKQAPRFEPSYVYAPYVPLQVTHHIMKPLPKAMHVTSYPRKKLDDIIFFDGDEKAWFTSINWDIDQSGELVALKSQRNSTLGVVVGQRIESSGHSADILWISPPLSESEIRCNVIKNRPTNLPSSRFKI